MFIQKYAVVDWFFFYNVIFHFIHCTRVSQQCGPASALCTVYKIKAFGKQPAGDKIHKTTTGYKNLGQISKPVSTVQHMKIAKKTWKPYGRRELSLQH